MDEKIQKYLDEHENMLTEEIKNLFEMGTDEGWSDGEYDLTAAFESACDSFENNCSKSSKEMRTVKEAWIFVGIAVPCEYDDLGEGFNGKEWWFKHKKVYYVYE